MIEALLICAVLLMVIAIVLLVLLMRRSGTSSSTELAAAVTGSHERTERAVREEIARNRAESADAARAGRAEMTEALNATGEVLISSVGELARLQKSQLDGFAERLDKLTTTLEAKLDAVRQESAASASKARDEVTRSLKEYGELMTRTLGETSSNQNARLGNVVTELEKLTKAIEQRLDALRATVDLQLTQMQEGNAKKLEDIRVTVDEKLQGTLEKRLGESFKLVSERLEAVAKGLGEMQVLASGVDDLRKVFSNVKNRGGWGEVQLGSMLEQVLTPEQYATNVATSKTGERVEFAIRMPGRGDDATDAVWMPIDSKFPLEDYQRLVQAQEAGDTEAAEQAARQLDIRIKACAADICRKYIAPPYTTDFAILFLPTEGLFAEVIRRTGLVDYVQRECRVVIAGPTTLWSLLNSLQMGFRTLAIQKRSGEVWTLLAAVKTEFSKYGEVMGRVQNKLQQASSEIDKVAVRSRAIDRKLRTIHELPIEQAGQVLMLEAEVEEPEPA